MGSGVRHRFRIWFKRLTMSGTTRQWNVSGLSPRIEGELSAWLFPDIRSVQRLIATEDTERLVAWRGAIPDAGTFDVVMRPGWCLMQSRFLIGAMAVSADGGGTRRAARVKLRAADRPLSAWVDVATSVSLD